MKHLYVLRHAKAVSAGDADDDFARELSPSGHADATRLGEWLAQRDHRPDMVLCSPARRTVETWQDVSQAWQGSARTEFPKALYLASAAAILVALRKAVPDSLMVIGHNPGLENLALHLVRRPQTEKDRERTRKLAEGMPTCALAIFDFAIASWKEVARRDGELTAFVRPKDLKQ